MVQIEYPSYILAFFFIDGYLYILYIPLFSYRSLQHLGLNVSSFTKHKRSKNTHNLSTTTRQKQGKQTSPQKMALAVLKALNNARMQWYHIIAIIIVGTSQTLGLPLLL